MSGNLFWALAISGKPGVLLYLQFMTRIACPLHCQHTGRIKHCQEGEQAWTQIFTFLFSPLHLLIKEKVSGISWGVGGAVL